jgi:N-acetylglucosaminyldiphosphoundecaprenol N-acetyl-beta-D-mannosaminyltransferase
MLERNKKINILGVGINAIKLDDAIKQIELQIIAKNPSYVCICPNHTIMESQKDKTLKNIVNSAYMATPDGMSVVWVCKLLGYKGVEQICGTDLMLALSAISAEKGYTNFYYGGAEGVPEKLAENLCQKFPGLKIAGIYSPPFRPLTLDENQTIIDTIKNTNPDILWVGLGMPKQELWMGEHFGKTNVPVMIGVGAAFDFLSGNKKRAPKWMQKSGLEWLYRLAQEPKRLWRRNLYHPIFFYYVFLQQVRKKLGI